MPVPPEGALLGSREENEGAMPGVVLAQFL